jgi:deazaflavin-dependent oxidoreductase (nitroreductase family)
MSRSSEVLGRLLTARWFVRAPIYLYRLTDEYVIVSGFGEQSQWYRNVVANPHVRVSVGLRCNVSALATQMTREAAGETLDRYAERHPRTWRTLQQSMAAALNTPDLALPMVRLELAHG